MSNQETRLRAISHLGVLGLCLGGLTSCSADSDGPGEGGSLGRSSQTLVPLALDKMVVTHQATSSSSISAPALTTTEAGELVVAFVASDGPNPGNQSITAVTGTGLTFRLRRRTNAQAGTAEIWQAVASSALNKVVVKATRSSSYSGSIVVAAFVGANTAVDGATGSGNGTTGGPTASLVTTQPGSWVWGVGADWSRAVARTVGPAQTKDDEYLAPSGDTFWVQHVTATAPAAGTTVVLSDTAPTNDLYNLSIIEIPPAGPPDTIPPTAPSNLVGTPFSATRVDLSWTPSTDNVAVTGYQVFRDSAKIATTTGTSFSDPTVAPASTHQYLVVAVDGAGNLSPASNDVAVTTPLPPPDTTPPTVSITSPANGAAVSGNVSVTATAGDNVGVVGVQFLVDGANLGTELTSPPYSATWSTSGVPNGAHTLGAQARDAAGNVASAANVGITLTNAGDPSQVGAWGPLVSWPEVSIHQALTYTGKILTFQGDFTQGGEQYLLDPTPGTFIRVPDASVDLFCAGQAVTADGRILVIGGTATNGGLGIRAVTAFNPATETWQSLAPMLYPRWYATGTTLGDGRILVTSGDNLGAGDIVPIPEVYDVPHNSWSALPGASNVIPVYPFVYQLPDGRVLQAGASEEATSTQVLDVAAQRWTMLDSREIDGASICNYAPNKFIKVGSASDDGFTGNSASTAFTLDMSQASPTWQPATSMAFRRSFVNLTSLPGGMVLATGGGTDRSGEVDANGVLPAEQWNPATGTWTTLSPMAAPRLYHSGAVLLPDGRVFVSGGGGTPDVTDQKSYQIYSPPYLFKGARPILSAVSATVQYNSVTFVQTPDAASIARVSLIRTGSVTHSFDQNARALSLAFAPAAGGIDVQLPPNGNTAPPGYYLLFIVNDLGVPSLGSYVRFPAAYEDLVPPTAPSNLVATGDVGLVALTWSPATDNVSVASYDVFRSTTSGFAPTLANRVATGITTTALNDLVAPGTYYYRVKALDAAGNASAPSNEAAGTPAGDATPPTAPSNLTAQSVGVTQVSLGWGASTDNVGIDHYAVARNGVTIALVGPTTTSYVDATVAASTAYAYSVTAVDTAGNISPASNTVNVTTLAPTGITIALQVVTHQATSSVTLSSPAFTTTSPNTLLVAFMSSDTLTSSQSFPTVTGGGLSWRLRQRTNVQLGTAEIWQAVAVTPVTGAVVTATRGGGAAVGSMLVVGFLGADTTTDGAVGTGNAAQGAPTASLTTTRAGSLVWGVGTDFDHAVARTVGSNATKVDEYLAPTDDTYWVERLTSPAASAGLLVRLTDTAPAGNRYDFSLIEILRAP